MISVTFSTGAPPLNIGRDRINILRPALELFPPGPQGRSGVKGLIRNPQVAKKGNFCVFGTV
jgi:hypothetical protein